MSGKSAYWQKRLRELSTESEAKDYEAKRLRELSPCLFCGNTPNGCWCDYEFIGVEPEDPKASYETVNEWQPELWETLPNNQMQEEDTVWDWLQQSVISTQTRTSKSPSPTTKYSGSCSPIQQGPPSLINSEDGVVSRTRRMRRGSLSPLKKQLEYSITTNSTTSNTPSLLETAVQTMQHSMDQCSSEQYLGLEKSTHHKEISEQPTRISVSCQTVKPTCSESNMTRMKPINCSPILTTSDKWKSVSFPSTSRTLNQRELPFLKEITISPPFRSTTLMEGTTHSGEGSSFNADQLELPQEHTQSMSPSFLRQQSPSVAGDGSPKQQSSTQAIYWALTSWEHTLAGDTVLMLMKQMKHLVSLVGSATHPCTTATSPHQHWLIRLTSFPLLIKQHCWVSPLTPTGEDTLREALAKYINYIKGKGLGHIEMGPPMIPA